MPRYRLTIAYDGTHFHGWQKQHPPSGGALRTVQGVLEDTVRTVVREEVNVLGASRTDSGVHAMGQVAAFTCDLEIEPIRMLRAINSRLPGDVQVRRAAVTTDEFNPISDAVSKGYRYTIAHSCKDELRPLFDRHFVTWTAYELNASLMHEAAQQLIGTHDFASFTRKHHGRDSTVRTILSCSVAEQSGHRVQIDVSGNGFLYNMVRIIAGTLLDVGRGMTAPGDIPSILEARDRTAAGPTLPPEGLCLMWVRYPEDAADS